MSRIRKPHPLQLKRDRASARVVRTGDLFTSDDAIQTRAGRIDARYRALSIAVHQVPRGDADPLGDDWRAAWAAQLESWKQHLARLRAEGSELFGDESGTLDAYDRELDAYRVAYESRTGRDLGTPTSETGTPPQRGGGWGSWFSGATSGATLAVVLGGGLLLLAASRR